MVINFQNMIKIIEHYNMNRHLGPDVDLIFDINGFRLQSKDKAETDRLNTKWSMFLKNLNKQAFVEEFLTVEEVATHLKVSRQTVLNLLKNQDSQNPEIRYLLTNKGYRIFASDYKNYLEKNYKPQI